MGGTLIITRKGGPADLFRRYQVLVNDRVVGNLKRHESKQFSLPSGVHVVRMKIDWCGSTKLKIHIAEGGVVRLECGSNIKGWRIFQAERIWEEAPDTWIWLRAEPSCKSCVVVDEESDPDRSKVRTNSAKKITLSEALHRLGWFPRAMLFSAILILAFLILARIAAPEFYVWSRGQESVPHFILYFIWSFLFAESAAQFTNLDTRLASPGRLLELLTMVYLAMFTYMCLEGDWKEPSVGAVLYMLALGGGFFYCWRRAFLGKTTGAALLVVLLVFFGPFFIYANHV